MTTPLRLAVVALGDSSADDVAALVGSARSAAAAAGATLVEPVPVLVARGRGVAGERVVAVPAWGDAVAASSAAGPLGAVQRIVSETVSGVARLVAARRERLLLRRADIVVAADRASELLVWSLRRSSSADLTSGGRALMYAVEERTRR